MEADMRLLLVATALLLSGCTHLYRTAEATLDCPATTEGVLYERAAEGCRTAQGEAMHYAGREGSRAFAYTIHFIEFDDQGWPYEGGAWMDRVLRQVRERIEGRNRPGHGCVPPVDNLNLIIYVHGWKHTAAHDDGNVRNFRKLVRESAVLECGLREVVGVYIGWRGRPFETPEPVDFLDNLTFWDRKAVAIDVAQGSLREFFARLDAIVDRANSRVPDGKPVRMLMVGHSFGGHILLTALGGSVLASLASRVDDPEPVTPERCRDLGLSREGDMIVLVNPAIEATRFEPLFAVARRWDVPCYKVPILLAVTSTGDWATGKAFPVGRWLSTWFEHYRGGEQRTMDRQALGHSEPLLTHVLGRRGDGEPFDQAPRPFGECESVWRTNRPDIEDAVRVEYRNMLDFTQRLQSGVPPEAPRAFCAGAVLVSLAGVDGRPPRWRAPLMNHRVTPSLVADHNDIYDPRFVSFLRELYMDTLVRQHRAR
jgi:hypothetical protein